MIVSGDVMLPSPYSTAWQQRARTTRIDGWKRIAAVVEAMRLFFFLKARERKRDKVSQLLGTAVLRAML